MKKEKAGQLDPGRRVEKIEAVVIPNLATEWLDWDTIFVKNVTYLANEIGKDSIKLENMLLGKNISFMDIY